MQSQHFYCLCMEVIISPFWPLLIPSSSSSSGASLSHFCGIFIFLFINFALVATFVGDLSYLVAHYTPCYPTHAAKVSHLWRSLQPLLGGMLFYLAFICYLFVKLVNKVFSTCPLVFISCLVIKRIYFLSFLQQHFGLLFKLSSITLRYFGGLLHSVLPNPSGGQGLTLMEKPSTIQRR